VSTAPAVPLAGDLLPLLLDAALPAGVTGELPGLPPQDDPATLTAVLHRTNATLWAAEDDIRRAGISDRQVVELRRFIERLNMRRNELIDRLNLAYARRIPPVAGAPLVTEPPGSALDRLSVLVLRLVHTGHRAATDPALHERLPLIREHLADLREAIDLLLRDVMRGRRRFAVYGAAKLYGNSEES
jgi:hypothetical protein